MEENRTFFNVPSNSAWILRNTFFSKPVIDKVSGRYVGYEIKREGWRYRIPILQADVGVVGFKPHDLQIGPLRVNCPCGNQIDVEAVVGWWVKNDDTSPIGYLLNTRQSVDFLVEQVSWAALNLGMINSVVDSVRWGPLEKRQYGTRCSRLANNLLATEKDYGIEVIIHLFRLKPVGEAIRWAIARNEIVKIKAGYASNKVAALKILLSQTGADATKTAIVETIIAAVRDIVLDLERK